MAIEISPAWRALVHRLLPDLVEGESFEFASAVDFNYNCLSWALSIDRVLLDDVPGGFWPWNDISPETLEGWVEVCRIHGFTATKNVDTSFVPGFEKIAIFENDEGDLHATRQDQHGTWKSKLGEQGPDIDHEGLAPLEPAYGKIVRVLEKRRPDWD